MPLTAAKQTKFVPPKEAVISWNSWKKGLNLLLRENEIDKEEVVNSTNLLLKGAGIPTRRWGSDTYFTSAPSSSHGTRFVMHAKDNDNNHQVVALSTWGIMVKKTGASYSVVPGASWATVTSVDGTQLGGNIYLVTPDREFVRYDFSAIVSFPTLAKPTNLLATNISTATGVTGEVIRSWRVSAVGKSGGETEASTPVSVQSLPQDLTKALVRVTWNAVSAASGDLLGYNIYRGTPGDERWIGGVDQNTNYFEDNGASSANPLRSAPLANATGGIKAKYILRFQDRLILAGIPGEPTKVLVSGRWPYNERFDTYAGGNFILIEPDSGEHITGLGIYQEKLVVFKENSVWQVLIQPIVVEGDEIGAITELQAKLLTASQGCSAHKSIVAVENDLMFCNRKGIYILRYEPQLLTVLNANEISAKVKPFFDSLSDADLTSASAIYADKKYVLSFPFSKKSLQFDRERLAFMGPWPTPYGIAAWDRFVDESGMERWVAADYDDNEISEFRRTFRDDKGEPINTIFKSKKEDFGDWTLYKTVNEVYMNFRGLVGSVNVNIYLEDRSGKTIVAKAFTLTAQGTSGTSGFGTDTFGTIPFGLTNYVATTLDDELPKKSFIYKTSRIFQVEIRTEGRNDNYELLGVKAIAIPQARGNSPSSWTI